MGTARKRLGERPLVQLEGGRLWDYPDCNYTGYLAERQAAPPNVPGSKHPLTR